ncbi:acyltransferase family protein [Hwanghaeella grinnelliae]|uniref:acyltransferase family protein n=1 Tax=Hwanghaeella grinnelliae TaxID=2500179 RepID=UPI001386FB98|nr:acyltransferase family protein [Hwanghaeella grinnelliae]
MKYRAEIDGLRALAVVPVILFHAGFELFGGGFVGVDVFFVISGYLITTILVEDIENKRFSIAKFYERRARRILPALFFVILVCIPFAWMWMLPTQMKDFSQSLVAVSLFASNILFWRESGYFDAAAEEKPLLHTWSLAVEEQYYVLFPILLIFAWRFGKNRVFWMIVVMATISLLLSEWGWRNTEIANFYLAPTRAWELFSGSIAAFLVQKNGVKKNSFLALFGLAIIVFCIFFYDEEIPFPSLYALVPVFGVVLLILYADRETLAAKILSSKAFVGIGLISYSAYLWHQPLFAFARIRLLDHPPEALMLTLSLTSLVLAYLSWKYIEIPFRNRNKVSRKLVYTSSMIMLFIPFGLGLYGHFANGFENRIASWEYLRSIPVVGDTYCHNEGRRSEAQLRENNFCIIGDGSLEIAIIGDSHAGALFDAANDFLISKNRSALAVSGGYCAPLLNGFSDSRGDCAETIQTAINHAIASENISTIIIAAEWANYTTGYRGNDKPRLWADNLGRAESPSDNIELFKRSFANTFETLSASNKRVIIIEPVPEFHYYAHDWVGRRLLFSQEEPIREAVRSLPSISVSEYDERNQAVFSVFNRHSSPNVSYVNTKSLFCDEDKCYQYNEDGLVLYSDFNHVNYHGAQKIIRAVSSFFNR